MMAIWWTNETIPIGVTALLPLNRSLTVEELSDPGIALLCAVSLFLVPSGMAPSAAS